MSVLKKDQLEELIQKAKDHRANVSQIVSAIFDAEYYLNILQNMDKDADPRKAESFEHYQSLYRQKLDSSMAFLTAKDQRDYSDSFGSLFTLMNHLEARYKKEILSNSEAISDLNTKDSKNTKSEA